MQSLSVGAHCAIITNIEKLSLYYFVIKCIQSSLTYSAHHNKTLRLLFIKLSLSK